MTAQTPKLSEFLKTRQANKLFVSGAVSIVVIIGLMAFLLGTPASNALLQLMDGKAWLSDDTKGTVMLANGATGNVDVTVPIPDGKGGQLRVVRVGKHSLVINDRNGKVTRLDLANLKIAKSATLAGNGLDVIPMGKRLLVVHKAKGLIELFDPMSLKPLGRINVGSPLTRAVVDAKGVAWVADSAGGELISITWDETKKKLVQGSVGIPGKSSYQLASVKGAPTLVDAGRGTIQKVVNGKLGGSITAPFEPNDKPAVARVIEGSTIPIAASSDSNGAVIIAEEQRQFRTPFADRNGHEFGEPVMFTDRVYLPDYTTGELITLDSSGGQIGSAKKIGPGKFSVRVEEGYLWIDDAGGKEAFVVSPNGKLRPINQSVEPTKPGNEIAVEPDDPTAPNPTAGPEGGSSTPPPTPPPVEAVVPTSPPAPPSSVEALAGNRTAIVSWTGGADTFPVGTASSYRVAWSAGNKNEEKTVPGETRSLTVSSLTNGNPYTFAVSAINSVGESTATNSNTIKPSAEVPEAPTKVTARANKNGNVDVSWTAADGQGNAVSGYTVSASAKTGTGKIQLADGVTATSFKAQAGKGELTLGESYVFRVVAINELGKVSAESAPSGEVQVYSLPGAPGGLNATATSGTVALSWSAPALNGGDFLDYVVAANGVTPKNVTTTTTTFSGLKNGTTYTFTVAVRTQANRATVTGPTTTATATPGTAPAISVAASFSGDRNINWSYNFNANSSGAATCTVFRDSTPIWGPAPCEASASGSNGGLAYSTTYTIKGEAKNPYGTNQSQASARTNDPPPPPPPPPAAPVVNDGIVDAYLGGTWARSDPGNGTWYNSGTRPPNGVRWIPGGYRVDLNCTKTGGTYTVSYKAGGSETWSWWVRLTDGTWVPSVVTGRGQNTAYPGLHGC